jgi:hypothetical protein
MLKDPKIHILGRNQKRVNARSYKEFCSFSIHNHNHVPATAATNVGCCIGGAFLTLLSLLVWQLVFAIEQKQDLAPIIVWMTFKANVVMLVG